MCWASCLSAWLCCSSPTRSSLICIQSSTPLSLSLPLAPSFSLSSSVDRNDRHFTGPWTHRWYFSALAYAKLTFYCESYCPRSTRIRDDIGHNGQINKPVEPLSGSDVLSFPGSNNRNQETRKSIWYDFLDDRTDGSPSAHSWGAVGLLA